MVVTDRERHLGAELKLAREKAGYTQAEAGKALGCSQSKIQKIEAAITKVSSEDLTRLMDVYNVSDETRRKIIRYAKPAGPGSPTGLQPGPMFSRFLSLERGAAEVLAFHSERLPTALQCERYLLKQYQLAGYPVHPETLLRDRRQRQRSFTAGKTEFRVVVSQSSLTRMPGGRTPSLVREQALYLLELTETYPRLSLRVLTEDAPVAYIDSDMILLKFAAQQSQVYFPYGDDGRLIKAKRQVARQERYWRSVYAAALDERDSRKHIDQLTR